MLFNVQNIGNTCTSTCFKIINMLIASKYGTFPHLYLKFYHSLDMLGHAHSIVDSTYCTEDV